MTTPRTSHRLICTLAAVAWVALCVIVPATALYALIAYAYGASSE